MAEIRSLKLALLADTKNFIQGLDKADKETRTFSNKLDDALKKGAAAFLAVGAAAGAMAIKIGIDAVKAAIEDEKAQKSLAITLKNTTKATDAQVKSVEDYIDKTARATGVADDQLIIDAILGATYNETVLQLVKDLGVGAQPLRLDLTTATRQYTQAANVAGFGTRAITSDKSEASLIGWLLRLSFYGNDELGSVALANVDLPEDRAIQILVDWLKTPKGQQLKKEATAVSDLKIDDITYATRVYQNAKDLVTQRKDGNINTNLLNKIRQLDPNKPLGDIDSYVITGKLGLDDVQNIDIEDMPLEYVGPELIPVVDADKRTSSLIQNDDTINLFTFKTESESFRFLEILEKFLIDSGNKNCVLVYDTSKTQKKYIYDILSNMGVSKRKLYRKYTSFPGRK